MLTPAMGDADCQRTKRAEWSAGRKTKESYRSHPPMIGGPLLTPADGRWSGGTQKRVGTANGQHELNYGEGRSRLSHPWQRSEGGPREQRLWRSQRNELAWR